MPLTRASGFYSKNYDYTADRASAGYVHIGSGADSSGLYRDDAVMYLVNQMDGLEKVTTYAVDGNVISGSGSATYATYGE
jgi:hypothetical protein